jgi:hypothetical protein
VRLAALIGVLAVCAAVVGAVVSTHAAIAGGSAGLADCPDYYVIDSRGSGEEGGTISPPGAKLVVALRAGLPGKTVKALPNGYPARGGYSILAGARLKVPGAYFNSVNSGKVWLADAVPKLSTQCPGAKIVLTGYSQGAQVTADVVQHDGPFKGVLAVVLFGDPYFNGSDAHVDRGSYRAGVDGGLGKRPKFIGGHVYSYCHSNDPVCQSTANPIALTTWHNNYDKLGEPGEAARLIAKLVAVRVSGVTLLVRPSGALFPLIAGRIDCGDCGRVRSSILTVGIEGAVNGDLAEIEYLPPSDLSKSSCMTVPSDWGCFGHKLTATAAGVRRGMFHLSFTLDGLPCGASLGVKTHIVREGQSVLNRRWTMQFGCGD